MPELTLRVRIVRRFPDPDPLLAVFSEEAVPNGVWTWPPHERAQRLRYALICLCAGIHPVIVWPMAFNTEAWIEADIEQTLMQVDDGEIEKMVRSVGNADWKRDRG